MDWREVKQEAEKIIEITAVIQMGNHENLNGGTAIGTEEETQLRVVREVEATGLSGLEVQSKKT